MIHNMIFKERNLNKDKIIFLKNDKKIYICTLQSILFGITKYFSPIGLFIVYLQISLCWNTDYTENKKNTCAKINWKLYRIMSNPMQLLI